FGSSADKVFATLDRHPYVAGEFVWNGFDYLGEPTPYYSARSSYSGLIDLAGFPKDRFYLYQARWRPDLPMAHILPHWNWPGRERGDARARVHQWRRGRAVPQRRLAGAEEEGSVPVPPALGRGGVRTRRTARARLARRPRVDRGARADHRRARAPGAGGRPHG